MEFRSGRRNFSRPLPSPLSTGALVSPNRTPEHQHPFASLPGSATCQNFTTPRRSAGKLSDLPKFGHPAFGEFQPHQWNTLNRSQTEYSLDLFRPIKTDHEQKDLDDETFPYDGLKPLLLFRNLRSLSLYGMMRSYQPLIWATVWLNPSLSALHLESALQPVLNQDTYLNHRTIDSSWSFQHPQSPDPSTEYLGSHGTGELHEEFGIGAYLDSQAINMAQLKHTTETPPCNAKYLPIKKLTLANFVVDGCAIMKWFDPELLGEIEFKFGCVDAGFFLIRGMEHVRITSPRQALHGIWIQPGTAKLVDLKRGKVVSSTVAFPPLSQKERPATKIPRLKSKLSGFLPKISLLNNKEKSKAAEKEDEAEYVIKRLRIEGI